MATSDSSDTLSARRYVGLFCACAAGALLLVSTVNYQVDPYLLHQWDSPLLQRLQPTREKLSVWGKTYAVARYRPAVVLDPVKGEIAGVQAHQQSGTAQSLIDRGAANPAPCCSIPVR